VSTRLFDDNYMTRRPARHVSSIVATQMKKSIQLFVDSNHSISLLSDNASTTLRALHYYVQHVTKQCGRMIARASSCDFHLNINFDEFPNSVVIRGCLERGLFVKGKSRNFVFERKTRSPSSAI
jgi:hypothetical protein